MEQLAKNLQKLSLNTLERKDSLSIYTGELTPKFAMEQIKRLAASFPGMPATMLDVLLERLKDNGFSDERLKASIDNLIDNYTYPVPTIAEIVGYDKTVKLYNHKEVCDHTDKGGDWDDFKIIERENQKPVWVKDYEYELIKYRF